MAAMRRWVFPAGGVLVLAVAVLVLRQVGAPRSDNAGVTTEFTPRGMLRVRHAARVDVVRVLNEGGDVVAVAHTHGKPTTDIPFAWKPGATYRVETDKGHGVSVAAPRNPPALAIRMHTPLGQTPHEFLLTPPFPEHQSLRIAVPVAPGEGIDILLEAEKLADDAQPLALVVTMEARAAAGFSVDPPWEGHARTLEFEFDKLLLTSHISIGDKGAPEHTLPVTVAGDGFELELELTFVPAQLEGEAIEVADWAMPTDESGRHSPGQPSEQIVMPNPVWDRLARWWGISPGYIDSSAPYAYQTVLLSNNSPHTAGLLVTSEILNPDTHEQAPYFDPPFWESTGGTNQVVAFVQAGPGKTAPCVLPIHVDPATPAGLYQRRIVVTPLGSDRILAMREAPLGVVRTKPLFSTWVAFITVLSAGWLGGLLVFYRRLVRALGVRALVLLSLLGSLQFCFTFAGGWVSSILYAVLGPFNCLVGGFLTEVLTYLFVTAILYLLPRVGAMTLAGLVSYLMGGILFGSFGLTDLLFVGSAIAFREVLLFAFRVTHMGTPSPPRPPAFVAMAVALGLADAASTFTNLALSGVFYRLFYANWYIVMNVTVTGFLYTVIGVYLGRNLAISLRKVRA